MYRIITILFLCISLHAFGGLISSFTSAITTIGSTIVKGVTSLLPTTTTTNITTITNNPTATVVTGNVIAYAYISNNQVTVMTSLENGGNPIVIDNIPPPSGVTFTSASFPPNTILNTSATNSTIPITITGTDASSKAVAYTKSYRKVLISNTPPTYIEAIPSKGAAGLTLVAQSTPGPVTNVSTITYLTNITFQAYLQSSSANPTTFFPYITKTTNVNQKSDPLQLSTKAANSTTSLVMDLNDTGQLAVAYLDVDNNINIITIDPTTLTILKSAVAGQGISNLSLKITNSPNPTYLITCLTSSNQTQLISLDKNLNVINKFILSSTLTGTSTTPILVTNRIAITPTIGTLFVVCWIQSTNNPYAIVGLVDPKGVVSFLTLTGTSSSPTPQALPGPANNPSGVMTPVGTVVITTVNPGGTQINSATTPISGGVFTPIYQGNPGDPSSPTTLLYNPATNRITIMTKGPNSEPTLLRAITAIYNEAYSLKRDGQLYNNALYLPLLQ